MDWIIIAGGIGFLFVWSFLLLKGKWFLKWPMWVRLASMLIVTAGMFALIAYMKKKETEAEATMMGICWDSSGQAHYPEKWAVNAGCEDPQPLDWKRSPKLIYWGLPGGFDSYLDSHKEAMRFWNKSLGSNHFIPTDKKDDADVIIEWGSTNEGHGAMSTSHQMSEGRITATITVKTPGDIRQWMLAEQHELGHVLGLAHDRSGIMSPNLDEGDEMKVWLLHDKDRDAVLRSLAPTEQSDSSAPAESD